MAEDEAQVPVGATALELYRGLALYHDLADPRVHAEVRRLDSGKFAIWVARYDPDPVYLGYVTTEFDSFDDIGREFDAVRGWYHGTYLLGRATDFGGPVAGSMEAGSH